MKLASKLCGILTLTVMLASICTMVYAQTVWVSIQNPGTGSQGQWFSPYWVGEIPLRIGDSQAGAPSGVQTNAYCMEESGVVYIGGTYQADTTAPPDNPTWKAISYILTWYNPPSNPDDAIRNQVAIWKLLGGYSKPSWLPNSYDTAGENLKNTAMGMDVMRSTDILIWTAPLGLVNNSAVVADPGKSTYFEVQLIDSQGNPRPNVKITFSAGQLLGSTDVFTNSLGKAGVTVNVPSSTPQGLSVQVIAQTRSIWPQVYLNLNNHLQGTQDLIGIGTKYDLTMDAHAVVIANLNVVPEVPLGTLAAVCMLAFGFVVWNKKKGKSKASA